MKLNKLLLCKYAILIFRYCKHNSKGKKLDIKILYQYESIYIKYKTAELNYGIRS